MNCESKISIGGQVVAQIQPDSSHVVGQATAIGISAGGISAKQLEVLKPRLENAKNQLQASDTSALTGEQISGDLLTATIWSWFAAVDNQHRQSESHAGIVENPGLSYGLAHSLANPVFSWGVVRQVKFPGVNLDIGHVRNLTWAKDNNREKWISYNRMRGQYMSSLEHAVLERVFNDPNKCNLVGGEKQISGLRDCPQGISAVKAIGLAASQGQKIYTLTKDMVVKNPNIVNEQLAAHSVETRNKVREALAAGQEVMIHQSPIIENRWKGAGYTSIDPQTGAGAYMIEGGSNGGYLDDNAPAWVSASLAFLMNMLGAAKDELKVLTGTFLGLLLNAIDAFDVFNSECYGTGEALIRALSFFYFVSALGALIAFGVIGLGILITILVMAMFTLLTISIKEAFTKCPIHSA